MKIIIVISDDVNISLRFKSDTKKNTRKSKKKIRLLKKEKSKNQIKERLEFM